jgi:N,N'-diacetylchitobiose transport system permease protein
VSSDLLPTTSGAAAGTASQAYPRRRRSSRARLVSGVVPWLLVAPAIVVIVAVLGYPLYFLVRLSFQHYGLFELIRHEGQWIGLSNYGTLLHDSVFWHTLGRTVVFTAVNVALTIVLGTLIAFLLVRVASSVRILITSGLVFVWAMPVVVAVQLWYWMTNFENGVVNYVLTQLHVGDFINHDWYASPTSALGVTTSLIVWGAIPFVTITVYAGLSQVPRELLEAASIDGAGSWRSFLDVTFPILKPIFLILTSLSIIWDFSVFTQPFLLLNSRPNTDYYLMSIYLYEKSIGLHEYGLGSAIAIVMVLILLVLSAFYVRQMVRIGEVR